MSNRTVSALAIILGLLLVLVTYVYATHTADMLPHYFPGYSATLNKVHSKHAIGAGILAILAFVYAWFQSGPKPLANQ